MQINHRLKFYEEETKGISSYTLEVKFVMSSKHGCIVQISLIKLGEPDAAITNLTQAMEFYQRMQGGFRLLGLN
jgi:hypothetical protein